MIEQIGNALPFTAFYSILGLGTTGLTVTVDVYRNNTEVVAAGACTDEGDGFYTYTLDAIFNTVEGVYKAMFKTATTTVDQQHLPAAWYVGKAGVENSDASILAVKAKTDALPTDPADESLLEAAITAATSPLATAAALAGVPTVGEIDTQLSGTHGAGTWGGASGSGSISWPITIDDGLSPLDGVDVWVSTDSAGTNVVARGYTNTLGVVTFLLDAGAYYLWKQLSGYTFINPEGITVS
jgi:hypothetical protein